MSKKAEYYTCEQDGKDHRFKTVKLEVNGVSYPQAQACRRCGSIFDFGAVGIDIKKVVSQLSGMDLSQFKLKEATETNQAVMFAQKVARASGPTAKSKANLRRLTDTMRTEEDDLKAIPPRSIWRMDSK